jgi:hypothetical protein
LAFSPTRKITTPNATLNNLELSFRGRAEFNREELKNDHSTTRSTANAVIAFFLPANALQFCPLGNKTPIDQKSATSSG